MIGLAIAVPELAVGSIDLDHRDTVAAQVTGQAGAVGTGPLDSTLSIDPKLSSHRTGVTIMSREFLGVHSLEGPVIDRHEVCSIIREVSPD